MSKLSNYKYTQTWFLGSEIRQKLLSFVDQKNKHNVLEIGCFEGLSSVFFADNLLDHPDSSLMCVDPFMTTDSNDHSEFLQNDEEKNFDYNISHCKNSSKIEINKITSDKFFEDNTKTFDFIYIDGCHISEVVKRDMENSFACLEKGGIMWMDDYLGWGKIQIKNTIDRFLDKYNDQFVLIYSGYQLAIRKTM